MDNITVYDIEVKVTDRLKHLEDTNKYERLDELRLLLDWILCGDEY